MKCYRIASQKYAYQLSGEGARLYGGRWNSEGHSLIYTAQTSSLAMLEILVHIQARRVGTGFYLMVIDVPDSLIAQPITVKELPSQWHHNPHQYATQRIGDDFITQSKRVVMPVPSAVNTLEYNYLINDSHPDFNKIRLVKTLHIDFDRRLIESYA